MTQEQKAKAYDEALKRAKFYHGNCPSEPERRKLEKMFPMLRESKDDRIRKSLIKFLTDIKEISESGRTTWAVRKEDAEMCKSFLAYLEKQKEQKPWKVGANAYFTPEQKPEEVDESTKRLNDNWMKQHFDAFETALKGEFQNGVYPAVRLCELFQKLKKLYYNDKISQWKPSEEQMEALKNSAYGAYQNGDGPALRELYEQLKNL